jgi:ribosome biogenesis protein SSF1/2
MAGPLGVSHLLLFSRSNSGNTNLRVALTPRGPTLHFQVEKYSLCKDVTKAQKRPRGGGKEYQTAPLLVMNNMKTPQDASPDPVRKQLEDLTTTIFQNMFPQISPQRTPLSSIHRIMLLNRDISHTEGGTFVLHLRHYAITTKRTGLPRRIRRLDPKEQRQREKKGSAIPNLNRLEDVSEYLLDPAADGFTSASETELDTDAEVEVLEAQTRRVLSKKEVQKLRSSGEQSNNRNNAGNNVEKRAVKLVELGPRMKLRLVKVEEGVCEGKIMWNEFIQKSKVEEKELDQKWDKRRREKEERKREQRANVERKKQLKANTRANTNSRGAGDGDKDEDEDDEMEDGWDSEDDEGDVMDLAGEAEAGE